MIDVYIWIGVWVVILIMLIISLTKIENRIAEDGINKMFEYLKKRKKEKLAMPRYIDANELRRKMEHYLPEDRELALKVLKKVPTADVRENVHASWVKVGQSFVYPNKFLNYACSKCGFDIEQKKFRFCPNCGADMRERRTDDDRNG